MSNFRFDEWERQFAERGETPAIPAATVVVLRDAHGEGIETLMLRRNSEIAFGGMWVFPGGRIDPVDVDETRDMEAAARVAAAREAHEEAGIVVAAEELVPFAYWTPPPIAPKRFATWFFAVRAGKDRVVIDDAEITHHEWMSPDEALRRCDVGEIELAPPTWVTLHTTARFDDVTDALVGLRARHPRRYETHVARSPEGPVAMWSGDAGYETRDPDTAGPRHRLVMAPGAYRFDESGYHDPA